MRACICHDCGRRLTLINGVNYSIDFTQKEESEILDDHFKLIIGLLVFCPECKGVKRFNIIHHFDNYTFGGLNTEELISITIK